MLWKLNFIIILVLNSITEFERKIENKIHFAKANTPWYRMTPCPRDAELKNGSRRKRERERAHLQNNIKAKPEQLKLHKTYPSTWP
jgi:hypothetical protein